MSNELTPIAGTTAELTTSKAKHFFVRALADFDKQANGKKDLLDTQNALVALQTIASHYPQVDSVEAAQLACIYIGQNWDANLKHCEPATILGAFMQLCNLGIVLRSVQPLAYLVNKGGKCTIFIGADGYQLLARRKYPNMTLRMDFITQDEWDKGFWAAEKGTSPKFKHTLSPLRDYDDAIAMYAILSLHGTVIDDIIVMTKKERAKYEALHKGGVWKQWGATMWATKLAKKIFKSIGLQDPDGSIASCDLGTNDTNVSIVDTDYETEFDTLWANTQVELEHCKTPDEVRDLYVQFKKKATVLGADGKEFSGVFTTRGLQLKPQND